ncbi:hypothetical protein ACW9YV_11460 [Paraburkholderia strydomiana]
MKTNSAMKKLLDAVTFERALESSLGMIADRGFQTREGCHFLTALLSTATNVTKANFPDCTGYECFVNSLHIEDYANEAPLSQGLQFVMQIFGIWTASIPTMTLNAIVSADEFSVVVKFHVTRTGQQWLSENIEGYEDPIMSIESSEDLPVALAALCRR